MPTLSPIVLLITLFILRLQSTKSASLSAIGADGKPKNWVLLIKVGKGGGNCKASKDQKDQNGYTYECDVLYADDENQGLTHLPLSLHDHSGPLYRTWSQVMDTSVAYHVWNDQSGATGVAPFGPGISAHDKGFLAFNNQTGVACLHTCPNWLYHPDNFRDPSSFHNTIHPEGDSSTYSQTFLIMSLKNQTEVNLIRQMLARENARLFYSNDGLTHRKDFPHYQEPEHSVSSSFPEVPLNHLFGMSVTLFAKHRNENYDFWGFFTDSFCSDSRSIVWSYVECADILKNTNVTDYNCYSRKDRYGIGSEFGVTNWYPNHMKLGYCLEDQVVAVAGWNHKGSQLERGSLFAVIRSKELHTSFSRLFPLGSKGIESISV